MKVRKTIYLILLLGVIDISSAKAQVFYDTTFRSEAFRGIAFTYNMNYDEAQKVFEGLRKRYKDHPAPQFLLALNRWWQTYVAADMKKYHHEIEGHLDSAIALNKKYEDLAKYELEYTFFQYMNYAFKARYHTLRKEWWQAAMAGKNAFPFLKKGFDFREESPEFYFGSGIYHYYAEEYPQTHPVIQPLMIFFPKGSIELGIEELQKAAGRANFAQFEAMFYLGDIYIKQGERKKGYELYRKLSERFPDNTWFNMEYGRSLVTVGKEREAREVLKPLISAYEQLEGHDQRNILTLESHFTTYLMSRVYLWYGLASLDHNLNMAHEMLQKADLMAQLANLNEDDEYRPAIAYALGISSDRLEKREKAIAKYREVLTLSQNHPYKERAKDCLREPCQQLKISLLGGS